ncbi:MAG: ABC transporter substrate-binding protein [Candidatus Dormiibacterota bacterium]
MEVTASGTTGTSRRQFLRRIGGASAALVGGPSLLQLLTACGGGTAANPNSGASPNLARGGQITLLTGEAFVPKADTVLQSLMNKWASEHHGWTVTQQTVASADMQIKVPAEMQAQSGADILAFSYNWAWLYESSCVDVSAQVKSLIKKNGAPFYEAITTSNQVNGVWRAFPWTYGTAAWVYRKDLWGQVGKSTFVSTYDELLSAGKQVLAKSHVPLGVSLGHASGDANIVWYPVLWAFGGQEVDKDGKTIALDSPATLNAVEWAIEMWNAGVESHATLSWDDTGNNKAWSAHSICATVNSSSIYTNALPGGTAPDAVLASTTGASATLSGPKGNPSMPSPTSMAVMKWSKNPGAAAELLEFLLQKENFSQYLNADGGAIAYPNGILDDSSVWTSSPVMKAFNQGIKTSRWVGWPGPPHRAASQAEAQYVIVDMFAKAVQSPSDRKQVVQQAASQLQAFYSRPQ